MPDNKVVKKLEQVDEIRGPFEPLLKQSVNEVCETYIPENQRNNLLEIGAGTGKLLEWLGPQWKSAITFTEPDPAAVQHFKQKYSTDCQRASAEQIPVETESLNAILSLCVLDIIKDIEAVAREAAKRLKTGGVFIHLLDMSVNYNFILREIRKHQLIPLIPPPLTHPELWQKDLILCDQKQFATFCELLKRQNQSSYSNLSEYLRKVSASIEQSRAFIEKIESNQQAAETYQQSFHDAINWLESKGINLQEVLSVHSVSSLQLFSQALRDAFADDFEISLNSLKTNEAIKNNSSNRYSCFCTGTRFQFNLNECDKDKDFLFPSELEHTKQMCELTQTAIHVFCASKK